MSTRLQRIGRYELSQCLARGKTSEVWIAFDPQSRSHVTIKVFFTSLQADSDAMREFRQSVERVAALQHPNIVRIQDMLIFLSSDADGTTASTVCIVMDYVEGQTLAEYLHHTRSGGKMRPGADMLHLFTSLSLAIDYAHQQGLIHGNLNPDSILIRRKDTTSGQISECVLTDFDYTRLLRNFGGTSGPFYLSPEQIRGHPATERSDVYSLGVILYELCTGVLPFPTGCATR